MTVEQRESICSLDILEKARQIARELVSCGVKAVILSGSAARGKPNPKDLDFMIVGNLGSNEKFKELKRVLSQRYGISVQLFEFSEGEIDVLIQEYKANKDLLGFHLMAEAMDFSGRHLSWPLIPLLSDEEFQYFFGQFLGYDGNYHPYITKKYIVLEGLAYLKAKRKELHTKGEERTARLFSLFRRFLSFSPKRRSN